MRTLHNRLIPNRSLVTIPRKNPGVARGMRGIAPWIEPGSLGKSAESDGVEIEAVLGSPSWCLGKGSFRTRCRTEGRLPA